MSYRNIRHWCIDNWENSTLAFMNDKAKIPVGEPGTLELATSHMRKAVTAKKSHARSIRP